ncbi:MAG: hypothetical protein ABFD04_06035 [Syntrophomonas sp.]
MKKKYHIVLMMLFVLLTSLTINGCRSENSNNMQTPVQNTPAENKTDAKPDQGTGTSQDTGVNQFTNDVSTDKKASLITLVKVQVTNAPGNPNPFHVSLDGKVGPSAARLTPGNSTQLQKEVYQTGNKYPITLTISRNGEAISVINQNLNSSNVSALITESAPNNFTIQWN